MRRALVAAAGVAIAAAAAIAFEGTSWSGSLTCRVKVKVTGGTGANPGDQLEEGVSLNTGTTTFSMGPLGGASMDADMSKRNDRNYSASGPAEEDTARLAAFKQWVHDKVLAATGIDVTVSGCKMKGKFVLNADFDEVKVGDKITFLGTVASGPDQGKPVKGSIKIKGALPRNFG